MDSNASLEVLERMIATMPSKKEEWLALKEEKREFGGYALAQVVAGLALDEIVGRGRHSRDISAAFEAEYRRATGYEEEMIRVGVFEELCVLLRAVWKDKGLYQEKRALVLEVLGSEASRCFKACESL